ncbi:unnamed protein product [Lepeophtheirus salmonis]|uniref:(salmon louse) hypothetical protein n=1 Tax=Lepeophtheirus salmonis TaxID=72036 RepID=A0A7R8H3L0_LEPSM|nr:unnamed protein product [Lepeophtheirus salmonis]CAF2844230.1 unnamed protein product [Lepeophtheirus salmonis]
MVLNLHKEFRNRRKNIENGYSAMPKKSNVKSIDVVAKYIIGSDRRVKLREIDFYFFYDIVFNIVHDNLHLRKTSSKSWDLYSSPGNNDSSKQWLPVESNPPIKAKALTQNFLAKLAIDLLGSSKTTVSTLMIKLSSLDFLLPSFAFNFLLMIE